MGRVDQASALHQLPKLCMSSIGGVCICVFGRRTVACVSSRSTWRQTPIPHRKRVDSSASTKCGMFNIHICRFVVEVLATWSPQCAEDLSVCLDVAKIRLNVTDLSTQSRTASKCKLMSPKWRINHLVTRSNVPGELSSKSPRLQTESSLSCPSSRSQKLLRKNQCDSSHGSKCTLFRSESKYLC